MKKLGLLAVVLVLAVVTACTKKAGSAAVQTKQVEVSYVLKVGTVLTENDPLFIAIKRFKKNIEKRTGGNLIVELYSGSQLGKDEDVLEQAKVGAGVGVITDPGRMASYVKSFGILGGPYIAKNYEEALEVINTAVYKKLASQFEDTGFKILSFNYFQGSRNLFTKVPIASPTDLKGVRVRSSGSAVVTKSLESMGANTTVIPWSEAYQALQQKVIDGVEVHNSAAIGSSIYEVTDYLTLTGHFQLLTGLVVSNSWFQKLPAGYQQILIDESYNAGKKASKLVLDNDVKYLEKLREKGIEVIDANIEAFREAAESAYDALGYRDLKDKIDRELGR